MIIFLIDYTDTFSSDIKLTIILPSANITRIYTYISYIISYIIS